MFHKNYLNKLIITFETIDIASPIARPIIKLAARLNVKQMTLKQKKGFTANSTNKRAKKNLAAFNFYVFLIFFQSVDNQNL